MGCNNGICHKCRGLKKIITGVLLLLNAWVWPKWLGVDGWIVFFAVLMVLGGLLKVLKPTCGHCATGMDMGKMSSKSKKK